MVDDDDWVLDEAAESSIPQSVQQQIQETPEWIERLNPSQREAVETLEGPLLILAGAGTGKTRVLTTRLALLLHEGRAGFNQTLCVTFTNKAAREMRHRVEQLLGHGTDGMWLGTFHALGARILRRHADKLGFDSDFTILDMDDQFRLIKQLSKDLLKGRSDWSPRALMHEISRFKDQALPPEKVEAHQYQALEGSGLDQLYPIYHETLKRLNAMDFGDLLLHCINLFLTFPEVLASYQRQFRYILVDEYQDTNIAQYLWLRLLAQNSGGQQGVHNLCCVGDDDQAIYGWRGAEVGNILRFEQDFNDAKLVKLECNYRSSAPILNTASHLIHYNQGRHGKTLWTEQQGGFKPRVISVWDDHAEARVVAEDIDSRQKTDQLSWVSFSVLVRAGFQTRPFEEQFIARAMPYRVIGGLRFYEREESRDLLAYLRVMRSTDDDLALLRIMNKPTRGIGATTQAKMRTWADMKGCSLFTAMCEMLEANEIKGTAKKGSEQLIELHKNSQKFNPDRQHPELAEWLLDESGYRAKLQASKLPDAAGKLENLIEFVKAMRGFDGLGAFLDHVALVMDQDNEQGANFISIMTLHSAKGLEFDEVYLPGWEEQIFPNPRSIAESDHDGSGRNGIEEERRLAYVGITRARQRVTILHTTQRNLFGETSFVTPSRFINELPADQVDKINLVKVAAGRGGYGQRFASPTIKQAFNHRESVQFEAGDRVHHDKFGDGTVRSVKHPHIMVTFDHTGDKLLFADYLQKIA